ncbi:hypothetical protein ACFQPA_07505 [Halomarina halobia]|uniref:DUF7313 domain-containing protein n=1 Tax=Halomarina halobia TaxID=3033386 RepID=A0ABD6AC29_9EURY|nr:hypothetical protein [Halomarina sp. PSR21]
MEPSVSLFGPVDAILGPYIEYVLLALVVVNMVARAAEHSTHVKQARDGGADAVARSPLRVATNFLLLVGAFYFATVEYHAGIVFSVLVVGLVISDLFEFEARLVEARREVTIERPKSSITASVLVLLYAAYTGLFFLIENVWNSII